MFFLFKKLNGLNTLGNLSFTLVLISLTLLLQVSRPAAAASKHSVPTIPNGLKPKKVGWFYTPDDPRRPAYGRSIFDTVQLFNGNCSSVFIARDVVLTAAHCMDDERVTKVSIEINKNEVHGTRAIGKPFISRNYSKADRDADQLEDWGIAVLHPSDDLRTPYATIAKPEEVHVGAPAMSVGYPSQNSDGRTRKFDDKCKVKGLVGDKILTDCAISRGMSGGGLFVLTKSGWKLAGICSNQFMVGQRNYQGGPYSDSRANQYVNMTKYSNRIQSSVGQFLRGVNILDEGTPGLPAPEEALPPNTDDVAATPALPAIMEWFNERPEDLERAKNSCSTTANLLLKAALSREKYTAQRLEAFKLLSQKLEQCEKTPPAEQRNCINEAGGKMISYSLETNSNSNQPITFSDPKRTANLCVESVTDLLRNLAAKSRFELPVSKRAESEVLFQAVSDCGKFQADNEICLLELGKKYVEFLSKEGKSIQRDCTMKESTYSYANLTTDDYKNLPSGAKVIIIGRSVFKEHINKDERAIQLKVVGLPSRPDDDEVKNGQSVWVLESDVPRACRYPDLPPAFRNLPDSPDTEVEPNSPSPQAPPSVPPRTDNMCVLQVKGHGSAIAWTQLGVNKSAKVIPNGAQFKLTGQRGLSETKQPMVEILINSLPPGFSDSLLKPGEKLWLNPGVLTPDCLGGSGPTAPLVQPRICTFPSVEPAYSDQAASGRMIIIERGTRASFIRQAKFSAGKLQGTEGFEIKIHSLTTNPYSGPGWPTVNQRLWVVKTATLATCLGGK